MPSLQLQPADYCLCALAAIAAIVGIFRGFSGMLGFVVACLAAVAAGHFLWPFSATFADSPWPRGAAVLVAVLVVFGIVRMIVKKCVNGLLAQPTDALLGGLIGLLLGASVPFIWALTNLHLEFSALARCAAGFIN